MLFEIMIESLGRKWASKNSFITRADDSDELLKLYRDDASLDKRLQLLGVRARLHEEARYYTS